MYYEESKARELVIAAGLKLIEHKLIARTWGNISARIGEDEFIITPSGLPYETLRPEQLVKVRISDLSYDGTQKPSSEKGVHAAAYALRKDAAFVIHTHQHYATAVSVEGKDLPFAPAAAYALSGTKKLRSAVATAIEKNPQANAFLMVRHGAVCLGETYEKAFEEALSLEEKSQALYEQKAKKVSPQKEAKPWLDDYAQMMGYNHKNPVEEDAEAIQLIRSKNAAAACYANKAKPLGFFDVCLQHAVYKMKYSKLKDK